VSSFGLAMIYLRLALQQAGCPVCRCCFDHETRYLRFLLWENVNDLGTRVRMAQSLGFCGRHARQMLEMEREELGSMLGNSIIYEGLVHLALLRVRDTIALIEKEELSRNALSRFLCRLGYSLFGRTPERHRFLSPEKGCRVCELGDETARHYGNVLAEMLCYDEYRDLYQRSDGVCLPHLRVIVQSVGSSSGLEFLLSSTSKCLDKLEADLEALGRKHTVHHDNELAGECDGSSLDRAVALLAGSSIPYCPRRDDVSC